MLAGALPDVVGEVVTGVLLAGAMLAGALSGTLLASVGATFEGAAVRLVDGSEAIALMGAAAGIVVAGATAAGTVTGRGGSGEAAVVKTTGATGAGDALAVDLAPRSGFWSIFVGAGVSEIDWGSGGGATIVPATFGCVGVGTGSGIFRAVTTLLLTWRAAETGAACGFAGSATSRVFGGS